MSGLQIPQASLPILVDKIAKADALLQTLPAIVAMDDLKKIRLSRKSEDLMLLKEQRGDVRRTLSDSKRTKRFSSERKRKSHQRTISGYEAEVAWFDQKIGYIEDMTNLDYQNKLIEFQCETLGLAYSKSIESGHRTYNVATIIGTTLANKGVDAINSIVGPGYVRSIDFDQIAGKAAIVLAGSRIDYRDDFYDHKGLGLKTNDPDLRDQYKSKLLTVLNSIGFKTLADRDRCSKDRHMSRHIEKGTASLIKLNVEPSVAAALSARYSVKLRHELFDDYTAIEKEALKHVVNYLRGYGLSSNTRLHDAIFFCGVPEEVIVPDLTFAIYVGSFKNDTWSYRGTLLGLVSDSEGKYHDAPQLPVKIYPTQRKPRSVTSNLA